jgi:hypothetical protein
MTYDLLIKTISEIVENEQIHKVGLSLTYELPEDLHKKFNEELFNKTKEIGMNFEVADVYEVAIGGILVKFVSKKIK